MRFRALACDYDETLATDGHVDDSTIGALERARANGRELFLVTGRRLDDVRSVFPRLDLFRRVVAENGGVLFSPDDSREVALADAPPESFVTELRQRHLQPLELGRTLVATRAPYETAVLEVIRELGLELEIVFNKGAVMVLQHGITKCTGLMAALQEVRLSPHNVVSIGDGENDHAFLAVSECGVAVANAVDALKQTADWTTSSAGGDGVRELIDRLLDDDLASLEPALHRHDILLGHLKSARASLVTLRPYVTNMFVVGRSKAGKSSLTLGLLERFADQQYQYCLVDPEGDYERMPGAVQLGTATRAPAPDEVLQVLDRPDHSVVVSLLAVPGSERAAFMADLYSGLTELRSTTSRPHWLVVDEAHHMFPADRDTRATAAQPSFGGGLVTIAVEPESVAPEILRQINTVVSAGEAAEANLLDFARATGRAAPATQPVNLERGEALVWNVDQTAPRLFEVEPARGDRRRHRRKYAEGELSRDQSFYFRGPDQRLNLRAQNLSMFMDLADGVDDETWLHHLRQADYSRWMRGSLKDADLADEVRAIEGDDALSPAASRARVRRAIEQRYAPPA